MATTGNFGVEKRGRITLPGIHTKEIIGLLTVCAFYYCTYYVGLQYYDVSTFSLTVSTPRDLDTHHKDSMCTLIVP